MVCKRSLNELKKIIKPVSILRRRNVTMVPLESSDRQKIKRAVLSDSISLSFFFPLSHLTIVPLESWSMKKKKVSVDLKELDKVFWILSPSMGNGYMVSVAYRNLCIYKMLPHGINFLNLWICLMFMKSI